MWRNGTPLASRVVHGVTDHLSNCVCNLRVFTDDARGCQCPFVLCFHPQVCLRKGVRASRSYQEQTGKSGSFGLWLHPRGYVSNFLMRPASSIGSPSGCCGADKSGTALARPAPFLRPLPPRTPPPPWKVSGGRGSRVWPWWSRAPEGPIHSAGASFGAGPQLTACTGTRGTWVEVRALGGHLTLRLFDSAERKRERSPRLLSPKSSSCAAPKSARCSPAPSLPAPQLWCVAQTGPGARGPDLLARRPRC